MIPLPEPLPAPRPRFRAMIRLTGLLLLLLTPSLLIAQEDADHHTDDVFGFEITRPSTDWMFVPKGEDRSTDFSMVLTEPALLARVSVRVNLETTPSDPVSLRQKTWGQIEREPTISELTEIELELAGREAPGFSLIAESGGERYRVRRFFLVEEGRRFELEDVIVEGQVEELTDDVDAIWTTFGMIEARGMPAEELLLFELASKCGSEVNRAADWEEASARAREEGKLVAVAVHLLGGFDVENPWLGGSFMEPELIDLFNKRYVPVLFERGWNAPFEDQSSYGMGPYSFGNTLLLVTPDGEVVAEGTVPYDDFLRANLSRMRGSKLPPTLRRSAGRLDRAEELVKRGELESAKTLLMGTHAARGHLLLARIHVRERQVEAWAAALRAAHRAKDAVEFSVERDMAQAQYDLAMGRIDQAKEAYLRVLDKHADSPQAPEAAWLLGRIENQQLGPEAAKQRWMQLIEDHPESRWAWQAAYTLRSQVFATGLVAPLEWPDLKAFDTYLHPAPAPIELGREERAREEAITFLLETQYTDDSWLTPMDGNRSHEVYPKHLTEAVTAICARSLLPFRDRPEVARAIERGLEHLIERLEYDLSHELPVIYMDYAVWNRASQVYCFARCLQLGFGDREKLEGALAGALQDLRKRQHERGGWSYFISGDIEGGQNPITQSISFTTAYVILALAEARDADAPMPEGLVEDALGCLERMRNDNDTFVYMLNHGDEATRSMTSWENSAGRGPLCSLALLRHERSDLDEVRMNLEKFVEYRGGLTKQIGRALMHAGPAAEGSHWILFDYATAAEAVAHLPEGERAKFAEILLADIFTCRRADGSYIDNPLLGRAMGVGMALWAFESLGVGDD